MFGLIATLLIVPYTLLVVTGLRPAALSPALSFDGADEPGFLAFLALASLFSIGVTVVGWRALLQGARRDARRRQMRSRAVDEQKAYRRQQVEQGYRPRRPPRGPN